MEEKHAFLTHSLYKQKHNTEQLKFHPKPSNRVCVFYCYRLFHTSFSFHPAEHFRSLAHVLPGAEAWPWETAHRHGRGVPGAPAPRQHHRSSAVHRLRWELRQQRRGCRATDTGARAARTRDTAARVTPPVAPFDSLLVDMRNVRPNRTEQGVLPKAQQALAEGTYTVSGSRQLLLSCNYF